MLTREEIFVIYEAGPEAVISVIQRLENIIEEEQAVRIAELEERVKIVEARLNQNSQNSSKPPSTDVFCSEKPKPKSSRTISGKKAGGQKVILERLLKWLKTLISSDPILRTAVEIVAIILNLLKFRTMNAGKNLKFLLCRSQLPNIAVKSRSVLTAVSY